MRGSRSSKKETHIYWMGGGYAFLFCSFGGRGTQAKLRSVATRRQNGVSKGYPFGTQPLEQRCSVLYLLPRLTGKMRVSHDGHTRFIRQESGQVFRMEMRKTVRFQRVAAGISYCTTRLIIYVFAQTVGHIPI